MHYATLYQVRSYLGLGPAESGDDERLASLIAGSVASIDEYCLRRFDVRRETRRFDSPLQRVELFGVYDYRAPIASFPRPLNLDDDLLAVISLENGDGTVISASSYVFLPANRTPKFRIMLGRSSGVSWLPDSNGEYEQVIPLDGLWGYHTEYGKAWVDTLDTVQNDPLVAAETVLTVSNADGQAGDGAAARFQVGNLIRFGTGDTAEMAEVMAVDTVAETVSLERGANGTTATDQPQGTAIYVYRPMKNIVLATVRLAAWRYRQKDVDVFDTTHILSTGTNIIPNQLPKDVLGLLPGPKASFG